MKTPDPFGFPQFVARHCVLRDAKQSAPPGEIAQCLTHAELSIRQTEPRLCLTDREPAGI